MTVDIRSGENTDNSARSRKPAWLKGAALAIAAVAASFSSGAAYAQVVDCRNPVGIPALPPDFNFWGPAAVCAAAGSASAISSAITTANTAFLTQTSPFVGSPTDRAADSSGGGFWIRGVAGSTNIDATGHATASGPIGAPFSGLTVGADTRTTFGGFQAGADLGRFNLGASGWNVHFGVTGGYLGSTSHDRDGSAVTDFSIPFIGLYAAFVHSSGFFADLMLRGDFYSMKATDPSVGLSGQSFDGRGISLTGSAGYRIDMASNWFIEPSVGAVWSNVSIDSLAVPTSALFGVPAGATSFDDVESFLGRVGVRIGTSFQAGSVGIQPYVTASLWHEFGDPAVSHFVCNGCAFSLDVATTRVGTYGQFGIGSAAAFGNGWLGYARVDYRTGDNIEGWGLNFGLRYQWDQGGVVAARY